MKRLYTYTDGPAQGAVPRDFLTPEECLDVGLGGPVDPPGCKDWDVQSNQYGALPKRWAGSVSHGDYYFDFLGDIDFEYDPIWTDWWSKLSTAQQDLIYEDGCYCAAEGIDTPTLLVGPVQFPPVNALPFFWIPPANDDSFPVSGVREDNPVNKVPGNCCEGNQDKTEAAVVEGQIQLTTTLSKEPERRYRSTYVHQDYTMRNGFPRFCCDVDECDPEKEIYRYQHFPTWLSEFYDPYLVGQEEEPVGVFPVVMDLHYDREHGILKVPISQVVVHDGAIHRVDWDIAFQPGTVDDAPTEPGNTLPYNKDWQDVDLIFADNIGDLCADQCGEMGIGNCDPACVPDKYSGYTLDSSYQSTAASETDAIAASIALATAEAPGICEEHIVELCYSKRQTAAQGGLYIAESAVYCKDTP